LLTVKSIHDKLPLNKDILIRDIRNTLSNPFNE
jgi:hypothetical protein